MKRLEREEGFTLIELLVTVTIIGILAAVVSIGVGGGTSNATTKAHQGIFNQVQAAVDAYSASSTSNTLTLTTCDNANCDTTVNGNAMSTHYGPDGVLGSVNFATGDKYKVFSASDTEVVANGFLRLNASSSVSCVFSGSTTQVKACK